jgi:geranylgeranyl pyrophosphate synthase
MKQSDRQRNALYVARVDQLMLAELERWRGDGVERFWGIVNTQVKRHGKQLRPLLSVAVADLLDGDRELVAWAAASVELYHLAALVLDDVQDNSEFRRGFPTVQATSTSSTAINTALFIRSLSYNLIDRHPSQDPGMKLALHHELANAATRLVLGQSIDIGWHEKWYESYRDFPYMQMIEGKTGALFGCAAAMGACAANVGAACIDDARTYGMSFGILYQLINDYLDAFGDPVALGRPAHEDFREGKMTGPVICLLSALDKAGHEDEMKQVLSRLSDRESDAGDWGWILELMREHGVQDRLRDELHHRATDLDRVSFGSDNSAANDGLRQLVSSTMAAVR